MDENDHGAARVVRGRNRIRTGDADGPDVRAHIQQVAIDLFTEEGYDKTSLREIAAKLGVTKAALYYHFPTKDDIVNSLIEQRIDAVDGLLRWAEGQPRTSAMRLEFIERYANLHGEMTHENVIRFFERNQTLINTLPAGQRMRGQMTRVFEVLTDPDEPLAQQLRRAMSLFSIHASWFLLRERPGTEEDRRRAALEVATELLTTADQIASAPPTAPAPTPDPAPAAPTSAAGANPGNSPAPATSAQAAASASGSPGLGMSQGATASAPGAAPAAPTSAAEARPSNSPAAATSAEAAASASGSPGLAMSQGATASAPGAAPAAPTSAAEARPSDPASPGSSPAASSPDISDISALSDRLLLTELANGLADELLREDGQRQAEAEEIDARNRWASDRSLLTELADGLLREDGQRQAEAEEIDARNR